jgi:putative hemolysin
MVGHSTGAAAMISVEQTFYARFPRLAKGRSRDWSRPAVDLLRKITCEAQVNETLGRLAGSSGLGFIERALAELQFAYRVAHTDRDNIPAEGRVVIVANHPLGAMDALALLHLVGSVRRDVRVLANEVLGQLEPLRSLLLPLDVFGSGAGSRAGLRQAFRALEQEQALIVFPAGEVSRIRPAGVRDGAWHPGFLRFARRSGSPVVPVHIAAHNSPWFYGISMLAKPLATLMLPREMLAAGPARIDMTVGAPVSPSALASAGPDEVRVAGHMRRHVYRLATRKPPVFATSSAIAHPEDPASVRRALRRAESLGQTTDGKRILLLDADHDCPALREIGRLRELAFRKVGEGTGTRRDLDDFDRHYRHVVLWDEAELRIAGAYRLGEAGRILAERGPPGLYSSTLFEFTPQATDFLQQAVELGRSFVAPAYWGSRSLDYLWQGIGAYLRHHPEVRYLFGPVSLSASLPEAARNWIVAYHRHRFGDPEGLARARNPLRPGGSDPTANAYAGLEPEAAAGLLKASLADLGVALPVLYRQYVDLCEPDGVRFLDFGLDPGFGHCVDGLIRLDLDKLRPAKRARYLGAPRQASAA